MTTGKVLLAEDEPSTRDALAWMLRERGYEVEVADDGAAALDFLNEGQSFDLIVTDLRLPKVDGMSVLRCAREIAPQTMVLLVTAHASVETAIEALREGVTDYIQKPVPLPQLIQRIATILDAGEQVRDAQARQRKLRPTKDFTRFFVGRSPAMRRVLQLITQAAPTDCTVLITGESGVGKEVVARAIHRLSHLADKPFVAVNCAAIPESLLESELFGHAKGAFTGAERSREGLFLSAQGGTIFLDEIGELPPSLQVKLLRAIELKEILPIGTSTPLRVQVRIIASTNRDLQRAVEDAGFREDLYYRLKVFGIAIPPLRERPEDIPPLVEHLIARQNARMRRDYKGTANETMALLMTLPWKGNVRELDHAIEYSMIVGDGEWIRPSDLPPGLAPEASPEQDSDELTPAVRRFERAHIGNVLRQSSNDRRAAARRLGIHLATLYRKIQELGLANDSGS